METVSRDQDGPPRPAWERVGLLLPFPERVTGVLLRDAPFPSFAPLPLSRKFLMSAPDPRAALLWVGSGFTPGLGQAGVDSHPKEARAGSPGGGRSWGETLDVP